MERGAEASPNAQRGFRLQAPLVKLNYYHASILVNYCVKCLDD